MKLFKVTAVDGLVIRLRAKDALAAFSRAAGILGVILCVEEVAE